MALKNYDAILSRIAAGYVKWETINGDFSARAAAPLFANPGVTPTTGSNANRSGYIRDMEALPAGVTAYLITDVLIDVNINRPMLLAQIIDLGSINIGTGVFTDGSVFPTETELGVSVQKWGPVICEVTTTLNATPGNLTVTYKDNDGNTGQSTGALAMQASCDGGGFLPLASGDLGVMDIENATQSGGTTPSGVIQFWGVIPILLTTVLGGALACSENVIFQAFNARRIPASAKLGWFTIGGGTTQWQTMGSMTIVGDD